LYTQLSHLNLSYTVTGRTLHYFTSISLHIATDHPFIDFHTTIRFNIHAYCFHDKKSSSTSVAKSTDASVRPPNGSPSRIFWMLPRPQAIPRLPFELNA